MAATAEAQAEASKEAQRASIAHVKQNDERAYRGRKPSYDREMFKQVRNMLKLGHPIAQIAKQTDCRGEPSTALKVITPQQKPH